MKNLASLSTHFTNSKGNKMDNSAKIAHLGFIQSTISRMGSNSFLLKGWSVTLVAAIFALSAKDANHKFILLAYFPVIIFWFLDTYFLHQEKLFRALYEEVAKNNIPSTLFTMDTSSVIANVPKKIEVAFSSTIAIFHGAIISIIIFSILCPLLR